MSWIAGGPIGRSEGKENSLRHDSTPPGSWLRERYEAHRRERAPVNKCQHPVEDAFDPGPVALMQPLAELLTGRSPEDGKLELDLGRVCFPTSDYRPQMARELYDHDDCA